MSPTTRIPRTTVLAVAIVATPTIASAAPASATTRAVSTTAPNRRRTTPPTLPASSTSPATAPAPGRVGGLLRGRHHHHHRDRCSGSAADAGVSAPVRYPILRATPGDRHLPPLVTSHIASPATPFGIRPTHPTPRPRRGEAALDRSGPRRGVDPGRAGPDWCRASGECGSALLAIERPETTVPPTISWFMLHSRVSRQDCQEMCPRSQPRRGMSTSLSHSIQSKREDPR